MNRLILLYTTYVGQWGQTSLVYTFEAIVRGRIVARAEKGSSQSAGLEVKADNPALVEAATWDTTRVTLRHRDANGNVLTYSSEVVTLVVDGPGELIGPATVALIGGVRAVWVRTRATNLPAGSTAPLTLTVSGVQTGTQKLLLTVTKTPPETL